MKLTRESPDLGNAIKAHNLDLKPPPAPPRAVAPPAATAVPKAVPASYMGGLPSRPPAPEPTATPIPAAMATAAATVVPHQRGERAPAFPSTPSSSSASSVPTLETDPAFYRTPASTPAQTPASTPRVPRPSFLPSAVMLLPEAFRGEAPQLQHLALEL